MVPARHRAPAPYRLHAAVGLMVIGMTLVLAVILLWIDIGRTSIERETLVERVVMACRSDRIQTYLLYEACREANEQAVDIGLSSVPLPALEPAPMAPE